MRVTFTLLFIADFVNVISSHLYLYSIDLKIHDDDTSILYFEILEETKWL